MKALINATIYTGFEVLRDYAVVIENDKIKQILLQKDLPTNITTIDLKGANLSAGFIDLQLNGCGGVQFSENKEQISAKTMEIMQKCNERFGCTSFLPTLITSPDDLIIHAINEMKTFSEKNPNTALGLHIEGPFISLAKSGTHQKDLIRPLDNNILQVLCDNAKYIKQLTIAPENVEDEKIKKLKNAGICVSIGHTNASFAEAKKGIRAGAEFSTHLFNAQSQITGREAGVVGAVLDSDIYCGIIVDGMHVAFENVRMAKRCKGEKLCLVTDATAPAGVDIDSFIFAGKTIYVKNGLPVDENGVLSGSALTMNIGIKNLVEKCDISLNEAIRMATLYPAKAIKVDDKLGSIEVGKIANLTAFDKDFNIIKTFVNGVEVYSA